MTATGIASLTRHTSRCLNTSRSSAAEGFKRVVASEATCIQPTTSNRDFRRTMATEANLSASSTVDSPASIACRQRAQSAIIHPLQHQPPANPFIIPAQCTLFSFPELEPTGFATYPSTHLMLPLRRDLLHLAVTFEADATRQGTASTKWRKDVHGSGRKIRPQKGSGNARLGDKKSPMLRGGGVAFGPKPRDFSTDLPAKMYHLAWRTALSYRFRRGQLTVLDGEAHVEYVHRDSRVRYLGDMLKHHSMGHSAGRTLLVTDTERPSLAEAFEDESLLRHGALLDAAHVHVKDLLHLGRIMIERRALDKILLEHQADLGPAQKMTALLESFDARTPSHMTIETSSLS